MIVSIRACLFALLCCSPFWNISAEPLILKTSTFNFKPTIGLISSYDSNVFYEAPREPTGEEPNQGFFMRVKTGARLENRNKENLDFSLQLSSIYRDYFHIENPNGRLNEAQLNGRDGLDTVMGDVALGVGQSSSLGVIVSDQFRYVERPTYEGAIFGFERINNTTKAGLRFAPGGIRNNGPLRFDLSYGFQFLTFLNELLVSPIQQRTEKNAHLATLKSRWRFLPKNFLILEMEYISNDYNDFSQVDGESLSPEELSRDSNPFRAQIGISGLITSRLSLFLKGGYGTTGNVNRSSFEGFIGTFVAEYTKQNMKMSFGYQRDGRDSGFSNFYTLNRYFGKARIALSQRWMINGAISYDEYQYDATNAIDEVARFDPLIRGQFRIYRSFNDIWGTYLSWSIEVNQTDYASPTTPGARVTDFAQYERHLVNFGIDFN